MISTPGVASILIPFEGGYAVEYLSAHGAKLLLFKAEFDREVPEAPLRLVLDFVQEPDEVMLKQRGEGLDFWVVGSHT